MAKIGNELKLVATLYRERVGALQKPLVPIRDTFDQGRHRGLEDGIKILERIIAELETKP